MRHILLLTVLILSLLAVPSRTSAQTQEILGGNLLNGAINGAVLGAATMGLQNSDDFAPLRIGLGAGILYGVGMAAWDTTQRPSSGDLVIQGTFNQGRNSSIIILLDTMYGAAGGALIGMAGMLIADRPVSGGLQYGASAGAWAGFAFGLVDRFVLAERNRGGFALLERDALIELPDYKGLETRLGRPDWAWQVEITDRSISRRVDPSWTLLSVNWKI